MDSNRQDIISRMYFSMRPFPLVCSGTCTHIRTFTYLRRFQREIALYSLWIDLLLRIKSQGPLQRLLKFSICCCSFLWWRFSSQWLKQNDHKFGRAPFLCGLLFAIHPIHTEAVRTFSGQHSFNVLALFDVLIFVHLFYIILSLSLSVKVSGVVGRAELLSSFALLWALIFCEGDSRFEQAISVILCVTATLSKEQGFMAFPLCMFVNLIQKLPLQKLLRSSGGCAKYLMANLREDSSRYTAYTFPAVVLLYLRYRLMNGELPVFTRWRTQLAGKSWEALLLLLILYFVVDSLLHISSNWFVLQIRQPGRCRDVSWQAIDVRVFISIQFRSSPQSF